MKVSLNWLRDYVDLVLPADILAERLTLSGTKVDKVERIGIGWDDIVTAQILRLESHPNADRLQLCTVTLGDREQTVVTGATNIAVGDRVPFIGLGGRLPDGTVLEARKMRGIISEGMVLAQDELGIGDDHAGIYLLDPATPPGRPLAEILGDVILDLEITPNRPDCLSMVGVAREVAALTGQKLRLPDAALDEVEPPASTLCSVRVEDPDLCPRYTARVVSGITVGPSPAWLARRVQAAGMRSINNIVDISNYVMLEWGQPLHTFDIEAVQDNTIIVRRARAAETLETLDAQTRRLEPEILVIADADRAVGIAGVMGGANSEISTHTQTVLIESATFAPTSIRRTSQRLGLRSEASGRFEKGLPWSLPPLASDRAAKLIVEVCGGVVHRGIVDVAATPPVQTVIELPTSEVPRLLGVSFTPEQVIAALHPLGFATTISSAAARQDTGPAGPAHQSALLVEVPAWRADVREAADLVEEVARMIGFDNIPTTPLRGVVTTPTETPRQFWDTRIRRFLLGCGLSDLATYSLIGDAALNSLFAREGVGATVTPARLELLVPNASGVRAHHAGFGLMRLTNPLTAEQEILRPTLLPGLIAAMRSNLRHTREGIAFFELASCFFPRPSELPYERLTLSMGLAGQRTPRGWSDVPSEVDFYDLKGILEELLAHCGVRGVTVIRTEHLLLHPGRAALVCGPGGAELGYLGELHPALLPALDLGEHRVYVLELDADLIVDISSAARQAQPVSRFPVVKRDIAVVVPDSVEAASLVEAITLAGGDLLEEIRVFDVYRGDPIPMGHKSVACALTLQAPDRTLSDREAADVFGRISARLASSVGGQVRDAG